MCALWIRLTLVMFSFLSYSYKMALVQCGIGLLFVFLTVAEGKLFSLLRCIAYYFQLNRVLFYKQLTTLLFDILK